MLYLNDKVRVTKEAKEDTYDNAWWTEKDLIIDYIERDTDLKNDNQSLYSFVTVDEEEVPCSLYDYELELVESAISNELRERLDYTYELVEYDVDANINEEEEVRFLENICHDFYRDYSDLDTLIRENMDSFFGYSFEEKLEFAKYIEEHIDEFIDSCGVNSLRQALDGGIREYLFAQFFSNAEAIYKNLIFMELNTMLNTLRLDKTYHYEEKRLNEEPTLFLNFDPSDIDNLVDEFIFVEIDSNCIYDRSADDLYSEFCDFLSNKIED